MKHDAMKSDAVKHDTMEQSTALAAFSALASETRLDLVRMLIPCGTIGLPAGEIARRLDVSASRLSFHLTALEQAGLLRSRRESRNVLYSADFSGLGALVGYLLNDCCMAHPEVCARCSDDGITVAPDLARPGRCGCRPGRGFVIPAA